MGWMNLNDYLVIEAAAAARRQDLMNAGRRFPESQSWVTVVVLAVSAPGHRQRRLRVLGNHSRGVPPTSTFPTSPRRRCPRPGDQPRRPVGDDEQRVGLALDRRCPRRRWRWADVYVSGLGPATTVAPPPSRSTLSASTNASGSGFGRRDSHADQG